MYFLVDASTGRIDPLVHYYFFKHLNRSKIRPLERPNGSNFDQMSVPTDRISISWASQRIENSIPWDAQPVDNNGRKFTRFNWLRLKFLFIIIANTPRYITSQKPQKNFFIHILFFWELLKILSSLPSTLSIKCLDKV